MAESICRALRDGALEGELAPALTIKDSVTSPFALQVFSQVLSQLFSSIVAGKSQSRGLVVVSFSRNPSFYLHLLKNKGIDVASSDKREVKHMDKLYNSIIELGKGLVGGGKIRFSIAIDSKKKRKVKYRQNPRT